MNNAGGEGQAFDARRRKVLQQPRIGAVCRGDRILQPVDQLRIGEQHVGRNTRDDNDQRNEEFQIPGEQQPFFCFVQRAGRQPLLDDILVEAPETNIGDPDRPQQQRESGQILRNVELLPRSRVGDDRSFGDYHAEVVIAAGVADRAEDVLQSGPCAAVGHDRRRRVGSLEREIDGDQPSADQEDDLDDVRPDDGLQPSVDRIEAREQKQSHDAPHHRDTEHLFHGQGSEPCHGGQIDEEVEEQEEDGEGDADAVAVTFVKQLRHGIDPLLDHDRQQVFRHENQRGGRDPFVGGDTYSYPESRSRHADKLLGRDIGGDQRCADGPPRKRPPRQEIVRRALFLAEARDVQPYYDDDERINAEDQIIRRLESCIHWFGVGFRLSYKISIGNFANLMGFLLKIVIFYNSGLRCADPTHIDVNTDLTQAFRRKEALSVCRPAGRGYENSTRICEFCGRLRRKKNLHLSYRIPKRHTKIPINII